MQTDADGFDIRLRLMPESEKEEMIGKLKKIGYFDYLEEESCDPYDTTLVRLEKAGWKIF